MNNLDTKHHEALQDFNILMEREGLWRPSEFGTPVETADVLFLSEVCGVISQYFKLLARRHANPGGQALKINVWDMQLPKHSYVGAIGYHHQDALPYHRAGRLGYEEDQLYLILGLMTITNELTP